MCKRFLAVGCPSIWLLTVIVCCHSNPPVIWLHSRLYEPVNPMRKLTTTVCGLDVLEYDAFAPLRGKSVAVLTNQTGVNEKGAHILDLLSHEEAINLKAIFSPEHGLAGTASAGEKVDDSADSRTGVKVYSLYGKTKKPTPEQLAGVDIVLFYSQDAGARYYTKPSTLTLMMEACARENIPIWVVDRPNPVRGDMVEGPILDTAFASFVGMHPVPIRHGMTLGELAVMINESGWLGGNLHADLTVVPMLNWGRRMWWDETGLDWIRSSPNIPNPETALVYLGTCLFEGTNVSEGRGTHEPFLVCGAPWIEEGLAIRLNAYRLPGVEFEDIVYTPRSIEGAAYPKFQDQACRGVRLKITDRDSFQPIQTGVVMIHTIREHYPDQFQWQYRNHFDRLWGSDALRDYLEEGGDIRAHASTYAREQELFKRQRKSYLIYRE
ncbi:exo-beta-N-acetylmuramidase NamZ domain-containing protein [Candidatus Neomarinimicrobiota bacterium]